MDPSPCCAIISRSNSGDSNFNRFSSGEPRTGECPATVKHSGTGSLINLRLSESLGLWWLMIWDDRMTFEETWWLSSLNAPASQRKNWPGIPPCISICDIRFVLGFSTCLFTTTDLHLRCYKCHFFTLPFLCISIMLVVDIRRKCLKRNLKGSRNGSRMR